MKKSNHFENQKMLKFFNKFFVQIRDDSKFLNIHNRMLNEIRNVREKIKQLQQQFQQSFVTFQKIEIKYQVIKKRNKELMNKINKLKIRLKKTQKKSSFENDDEKNQLNTFAQFKKTLF